MKRSKACPQCDSRYWDKDLVSTLTDPWIYRWQCVNCSHNEPFTGRVPGDQITTAQQSKLNKLIRYLTSNDRPYTVEQSIGYRGQLQYTVTVDPDSAWLKTTVSGVIGRKGGVKVYGYYCLGANKNHCNEMIGYIDRAMKR